MKNYLRNVHRQFWLSASFGLALLFLVATPRPAMAQWSSSGVNIYYNSGNVGIGTTTPPTKLALQPATYSSALDGIEFMSSDNTTHSIIQPIKIAAGAMNLYLGSNSYVNTAGVHSRFNASAANASVNVRSSDGTIRFNTNTSGGSVLERMQIDAAGNVGIGTTTPGAKLVVNGHIHSLGVCGGGVPNLQGAYLSWNQYCGTGETDFINHQGAGVGGFAFINTANGTSLSPLMFITGTGKVGIGTTSPATTLHVGTGGDTPLVTSGGGSAIYGTNAGATNIAVRDSASDVEGLYYAYSGGVLYGAVTNHSATIRTNNLDRITVANGGNVGIGIAPTGYKLDVAGTINATGLSINGSPVVGGVASVFGRTGAVVAATNDYTWAQINKTTSSLADLTTRSAGDLSSGTVATARLGSGTANTTTFLRGDNTWAVPSGGSQWNNGGSNSISYSAGNVGIGTTNDPSEKLHVVGNGKFTGNLTVDGNIAAKYQDMAEWVPSSEQIPSGTVVVLDSTKANQVISSSRAYDTRVAGVISEQPGIALGESGAGKVLVATTGRVLVEVDASKSPIHIGDLLVTSDVPGVAMKSKPVNVGGVQLHRPGTLIGKALEPLEKGKGKILVLLSLQ
jgi:hypothetical protein